MILSKQTKLIIIILALCVLVFAFYQNSAKYYINKLFKSSKTSPSNFIILNTILNKQGKLIFPKIIEEKSVTVFPKELEFLLNTSVNPKIKQLKYDNNQSGFLITYDINNLLLDQYNNFIDLLKNNNFKIIIRSRTNSTAFIDFENINYSGRITLLSSETDSLITINIFLLKSR